MVLNGAFGMGGTWSRPLLVMSGESSNLTTFVGVPLVSGEVQWAAPVSIAKALGAM